MTINYPYLPIGKQIKFTDENNIYMLEAKRIRNTMSSESRQPTGAVVVYEGIIIGRGANQSRLHNEKLLDLHNSFCIRKVLHVSSGTKYWLCPGCAKFKDHAENRAVKDALKNREVLDGADLYLYGHWWCCK